MICDAITLKMSNACNKSYLVKFNLKVINEFFTSIPKRLFYAPYKLFQMVQKLDSFK